MTFQTVKMEVSKSTATGKRELIGAVDIFVPTLLDAGITNAVQAKDDKGVLLVDDNGLPVYESDTHNWLLGAIFTQVKAQARNRLKPQSLELKSDLGIATDWTALTADNLGGGGNPEALIKARQIKALFATFISGLGKSAKAQAIITGLFNKKDSLEVSEKDSKDKIKQYVLDFAETLTAEQAETYAKNLENVLASCDVVNDGDW